MITEALIHYTKRGYREIVVPFTVDPVYHQHTDSSGNPFSTTDHLGKVYVASGEQSFVELHDKGLLPDGKIMCITPCVRHEPVFDQLHNFVFLKLELMMVNSEDMTAVLNDAVDFHNQFITPVKLELTDSGVDILGEYKGEDVELGSYGVRKMLDGTPYVFGTGLALPRASLHLNGGRF